MIWLLLWQLIFGFLYIAGIEADWSAQHTHGPIIMGGQDLLFFLRLFCCFRLTTLSTRKSSSAIKLLHWTNCFIVASRQCRNFVKHLIKRVWDFKNSLFINETCLAKMGFYAVYLHFSSGKENFSLFFLPQHLKRWNLVCVCVCARVFCPPITTCTKVKTRP